MSFPNVPWLVMALHAEEEAVRHRHGSGNQGEHLGAGMLWNIVHGPRHVKRAEQGAGIKLSKCFSRPGFNITSPLSFLC